MIVGTTEKLARFVVETKFKDMPEQAVERSKIMFLDTVGVALAGTVVGRTGKIAIKYAEDMGGVPEAAIIGGGFRTSAPNAALVNGLLAHALDFDDWAPSGHPSSMLVATSLALGEKLGLSGKAVLEAYILGLDVFERIRGGSADIQGKGWGGTPLFGTMGSAAAAAKALGLNVQQTVMTLGIAASSASGILRERGTMTKPYQVGKAARNGVEAALLARDGFTGDSAIIENPQGFCDCFFGARTCDFARMTQNLGNPFYIISPGLGIKPYPCGGVKYFQCIEAILELRREHGFTYEAVDGVEIRVSRRQNELDIAEPKTGLQGKFSSRYLCARSLLDGKLTLDTFTDEKVRDPTVKEALGKVKVIVDDTIPNDWVNTWSSATVKLKDGRTVSRRVYIAKGDRQNPLPTSLVLEKYRDNATLVLSKEQVEQTLNLLQNLDQIERLRDLTDILIKRAPAG